MGMLWGLVAGPQGLRPTACPYRARALECLNLFTDWGKDALSGNGTNVITFVAAVVVTPVRAARTEAEVVGAVAVVEVQRR